MFRCLFNSMRTRKPFAVLLLLALGLALPFSANAGKKKKADTAAAPDVGPRKFPFDPTKLVWPSPPNIARVHWLDYFAGAKIDYTPAANGKAKASWMDRLAGGAVRSRKIQSQDFSFPTDRTLRHRYRFQGAGVCRRSKGRRRLYLQHRNPRYPADPQRLRSPLRLDQRPGHR